VFPGEERQLGVLRRWLELLLQDEDGVWWADARMRDAGSQQHMAAVPCPDLLRPVDSKAEEG